MITPFKWLGIRYCTTKSLADINIQYCIHSMGHIGAGVKNQDHAELGNGDWRIWYQTAGSNM